MFTYRPALKKNLTRPITVDGEPKFDDVKTNVLVKTIEYDLKIDNALIDYVCPKKTRFVAYL